ncbi:hypothetical protein PTSG_08272 [Salpingoeca rosetta]|uniref:Uncharacterized protein n=1 Tax=Salpingoeca rosetta (strain ATCC 50818 / BSB-021) TaxID=946362 RepID=F2UJ80_SALR5|nr:uncharacterized protein PTSG_08272 [Salpingoeca rosetta]EGD77179.1 hypothetical protein PTSG_08272 [Salpingoeca rosetta]|eukprot:XP_004990523.1 hypothetical protein PTSG_08272 [Salpingoeca rosetta]
MCLSVVAAIKNGLAFDARIAKAWLRPTQDDHGPSRSPPSICLCCCCFTKHQNAHRRGAETTVIKLASTGRLIAAMAAATFARHTRAFLMCFKSIVQMADILSQRQGAACRDLALTAGGGRGAGGAHWHGAGTGGGRSHACAATVAGHRPPEAAAPVRVLMLNGILDCLSNLHFIHIWQLFRVLTTLTFDRQRIPAAGLIDDENEDELKRSGTIAATTVTRTWLTLTNDTDTSIGRNHLSSLLQTLQLIYVDNTNSHQEQAHLSGCVNGDGGLTIDPPPPRPLGFRSLADPDREDAAGAVRDEAEAAGDCRRVRGHDALQDRCGDRAAGARCRDADVFLFLMSLQPFVWWNLSLGTDNLNPEEETVEEVQHESWAHPRLAWACSDDVLFRTVVDGQRGQAGDSDIQRGCWTRGSLVSRTLPILPHSNVLELMHQAGVVGVDARVK